MKASIIIELNKDMHKMIEKNINRHYISAGTFIRFRDKCFLAGQNSQKEKVLEMIDDCNCDENYRINVLELKQKIKGDKK